MKNIFITGGYGFIGSNFINYFFDKYPDVNIINIDIMFYCANENNVRKDIRESRRYKFIKGDVCDYNLVMFILNEYKIDTVINFCSLTHVDHSFNQALEYTKNNIIGCHTLLEACKNYGKIERFIHISTDEVYGESHINDKNGKNEETLLMPSNPYAASKAACEMICQSYINSFKMPIIITRSNNIFGPNQYPDKLIPKFINMLKDNKKVTIHGNGKQVRAFLFTEDIVRAFEIILLRGKIGEIYNISSPYEYSVIDIAKKLIKMIKKTENYDEWITYVEDRCFNDQRYFINDDKLKNLGWKIQWTFDDALNTLI